MSAPIEAAHRHVFRLCAVIRCHLFCGICCLKKSLIFCRASQRKRQRSIRDETGSGSCACSERIRGEVRLPCNTSQQPLARQITTQPPCSYSAVLQVQFKFFGAHERIGAKFCRFAVTAGCRRKPRDRSRAGCVECAGRQDAAAAALPSASELIPEQETSPITA